MLKLSENFKMTDKGYYSHEGVEYICEPYTFTIINPNGEVIVLYDENYKPLGLEIDGVQKDLTEYNKHGIVHYWHDPRYFLNNCEEISLEKYGLEGTGYLLRSIDTGFFESNIIAKINSDTEFVSYVFNGKVGRWQEFEQQRWTFTIHNIDYNTWSKRELENAIDKALDNNDMKLVHILAQFLKK